MLFSDTPDATENRLFTAADNCVPGAVSHGRTAGARGAAAVTGNGEGATVVQTPPNVLGVVDDGWQRWLIDIGNAGPDKGKGGKYLLLPPGYEGEIPDGYFVVKCPTYRNWVMVHGFVEDTGAGDQALDYYRQNFRIYPLASGPRKEAKYVSLSFKGGNTTHLRADNSFFVSTANGT